MDPSAQLAIPPDTTNHVNGIVLPIFAALAIPITYLPMRSFYRNRNFPACNLGFVAGLLNLITLINAIIWPNGDWTTWWNGQGLCDIQVYIKIPLTTAVATSLACLMRALANAIDVDKHNFNETASLKRRALICDIALCWTIPVIQIGLFYVVQVSRYIIAPVYGCGVQADNSWLTIVIFIIWAPLASLISAFHAVLIIIRLRKHRANLGKALSTSNSGFTARRYLKLFLMSLALVVIVMPIEFYYLYLNIPPTFIPYSWARVHNPLIWGAIIFISTSDSPGIQYNGWISVTLSFMLFCFFGFNDDAIDTYRKWLVMCGAGKLWPSLKLPREARSRRGSESETRTSWSSHFDLVSRAMHYFEGSKKHSQTNSDRGTHGSESGHIQSRKGSHATIDTIVLANITSSSSSRRNTHTQTSESSASHPLFFDADTITPAPSPLAQTHTLAQIQEPQPTVTTSSTVPKNRGIFSTFRTHIHLPFPLFSSCSKTSTSLGEEQNAKGTQDLDLEAQHPPRGNFLSTPATTISTAIWSDSTPLPVNTNIHASNPSHSSHPSIEDSKNPLSPKLGTRAYRERERREMEREMEHERDEKKGEKMMRILRENLVAEMGLSDDGGVIKTTRMERREEGDSSIVDSAV